MRRRNNRYTRPLPIATIFNAHTAFGAPEHCSHIANMHYKTIANEVVISYSRAMEHDSKLAIAEKRLADARAEVARWESFIATYRELDGSAPLLVSRNTRANMKTDGPKKLNKLTHTESVAASIIAEFGRPVPSPEMLKALVDRGVDIGGKEPASTLAARLSRAATIEFQRGLGWALRQIPGAETA